MSTFEKIIIPLIDDNIKPKDVLTDDFIGVYTEDINMPGLDYVYLVYLYDMENLRTDICVNGIDSVKNINNTLYHVIKFPIFSDLKNVLKGKFQLLSNEGLSKIYNFWKDYDKNVANYPFSNVIYNEPYYKAIPEETYIPLFTKKPWGITVNRSDLQGF